MFSTDYNILQEKQHEFAQLRTKRKCFSISLCGSLTLTHLALSERQYWLEISPGHAIHYPGDITSYYS